MSKQYHLECGVSIPIPNGPDGTPDYVVGFEMMKFARDRVAKLVEAIHEKFGVTGGGSYHRVASPGQAHVTDPVRGTEEEG